jgi:hypothetical protein
MNGLEDIIESSLESRGLCMEVVSKTGDGVREWTYYIRDRDEFTRALNAALANLPRLPIEIAFYEDPKWQKLSRVRQSVAK